MCHCLENLVCLLLNTVFGLSVFLFKCSVYFWVSMHIAANGLQLPEGGDFEALHCQPSTNFDRSTKLDLATEPPLLGRCCCAFGFLFCQASLTKLSSSFTLKLISAFNALNTFNIVSMVALLALLSSLEI